MNCFRKLFRGFFFAMAGLAIVACSHTIKVYQPPSMDLSQYGRLGMITFSDNAPRSVAAYATEQFQNQIQSAQKGTPIVELGTEESVLAGIGAKELDLNAMRKIGQKFNVSAVFVGKVDYSEVNTKVSLEDITRLKANVNATLNATLSVKLYETEGGATIWSNSTSWKRKLGKVSIEKNVGVSIGTRGYDDAYKKLIPDMVWEVSQDFRGRYVKKRVKNN